MIDFRELRIGNWIDEQGMWLQVGQIRSDLFTGSTPISLTPEWLTRFGFKGNGNSFTVQREIIMPDNIENVKAWFTIYFDDGGGIYGNMKIYYVHQLQNLYFALTGEELILTP